MKTKPMKHQAESLKRLKSAPEYYALGSEQGTGKTWSLLADAEHQFEVNQINGLLIVAPKGVHTNWVRREIPKHLSAPNVACAWSGTKTQKQARSLDRLMRTQRDCLAIFAINIDALITSRGYAAARQFMARFTTMMAVDESQRIKNPRAKRTQRVYELGALASSRRIMSGTLVANSPMDLYAQYHFLRAGLLGSRSYRAFVAEYAHTLPRSHPLVARARGNPQIVKRNKDGMPMYKNTERLARLIKPHTHRVLKKDCLDLPPKVYKTHYFVMAPAQRRAYDKLRDELRFERPDGDLDTFTALTIIGKLRQVTSGFVLVDGEPFELAYPSRLNALLDLLEDIDGKVIIWAHYREELKRIAAALGDAAVQYHGGINDADREDAVDNFQNGSTRFFVANPASGGTGLTLSAANTVVYFSNTHSLEQRLQSEDRAHRIGTTGNKVDYIDLVAENTIDERIALTLQAKEQIASSILDSL